MSVNNARVAAELQAFALAVHLVGLDRVHEVYTSSEPVKETAKTEQALRDHPLKGSGE